MSEMLNILSRKNKPHTFPLMSLRMNAMCPQKYSKSHLQLSEDEFIYRSARECALMERTSSLEREEHSYGLSSLTETCQFILSPVTSNNTCAVKHCSLPFVQRNKTKKTLEAVLPMCSSWNNPKSGHL